MKMQLPMVCMKRPMRTVFFLPKRSATAPEGISSRRPQKKAMAS